MALDFTDEALLLRLQAGFPLHPRPFRMLGDALNISEDETIERVRRLKAEGYIRAIRATFDVERAGAVSTLAAACVETERIDAVAEALNQYAEVTHNYERTHRYNLWFTVIADSRARIEEVLEDARGQPGVQELVELPMIRRFKISAVFDGRQR
ncbi:MAG: AsnC family transcriptional regulator [Armatimonadota bacterium]|nr:MAG: AsnC family transcriptional regulator [Armatimonadota bacterium]